MLLEKENDTNTQSGTVSMPAEFLDAVGKGKGCKRIILHCLYANRVPRYCWGWGGRRRGGSFKKFFLNNTNRESTEYFWQLEVLYNLIKQKYKILHTYLHLPGRVCLCVKGGRGGGWILWGINERVQWEGAAVGGSWGVDERSVIPTLEVGITQLVKHPTEKPGAILTRVRVPGAAKDFSPRVNFLCRLSYGVRTAPVYNHMHQHLCAR